MLRRGDAISAVARAVGYEAEASFGKAFKREMGMAPGEFRSAAKAIRLPVLRKNLSGLKQVQAPARNHDATHPEQGAPKTAGSGEAGVGVL